MGLETRLFETKLMCKNKNKLRRYQLETELDAVIAVRSILSKISLK